MNHLIGKEPTVGGGKYLFEDDYVDEGFDRQQNTPEEIRKQAHIANGGEALFNCPKCGGTGYWRVGYPCFKCKGKGKVSRGVAAAAKGKQTKLENQARWQQEHEAELAYIRKRAEKGNNFYAGMVEKLETYGTLRENAIEAARRDMAKDAEFYEKRKAEREAARPVVPTEAIQALFDRAEVKLVKTPIFRTTEITIKQAPATGQNPGALYVKDTGSGEYLGKIVGGKWIAKWGTRDVTAALQAVAADPTAEAIKYAAKFKACCCCGKTLRNPVSVLAVVGPVCGPRWGLDHLRMQAAEMLAAEKEGEDGEDHA
jgi:hypothetical protein